MNAVSSTITQQTIARPALHLDCPSWCRAVDEDHVDGRDWRALWTDTGPSLSRRHSGPTIGEFRMGAEHDAVSGELWLYGDDGGTTMEAEHLRQLAAHALAAAAWIESVQ